MIKIEINLDDYIVVSGSNLTKQKERKVERKDIHGKDIKSVLALLDTDSNYYWTGWLYKQFKDVFSTYEEFIDFHTDKFFEVVFGECLGDYNKGYNTYQDTFNFEREYIFSSILTTAKKKYLARKWKSDTIPNPDEMTVDQMKSDLKVTGLEVIKRDSPKYVSDNMYEFVYRLVTTLETTNFEFLDKNIKINEIVDSHRQKFYNSPFKDICSRKGVNKYSQYVLDYNKMQFANKAPINTKAAACWMKIRDEYKLFNVEEFKDKSKIHFCYTKRNKYGLKVVGIEADSDGLFEELELGKSFPLNYKVQFEKTFLGITGRIYEAIGFNFNLNKDMQSLIDML